jgi:hypothetical protein
MDSNGGGIDPVKYSLFQQHQDAEMKRIASIIRKTSNNKRHVAEEEETLPPAKRRRNRNKSMLEYIDENGILRAIPPKQSRCDTLVSFLQNDKEREPFFLQKQKPKKGFVFVFVVP